MSNEFYLLSVLCLIGFYLVKLRLDELKDDTRRQWRRLERDE